MNVPFFWGGFNITAKRSENDGSPLDFVSLMFKGVTPLVDRGSGPKMVSL